MSKRINELRQQRAKAIADARAILDKADGEKRQMSTEERETYDKHWSDQEALSARIADEERQLEAEKALAAKSDDLREREKEREKRTGAQAANPQYDTDEYRSGFRKLLLGQRQSLSAEESRALSMGTDSEGGYTVAPEQLVRQLIQAIDDAVFIRQRATVIPLMSAASLGVPTLDADPSDADWTVELSTGNEDSSMSFGKRTMTPSPVAKRIKVSKKLLRASALNVEDLIISRMGYKFGITQEKAFLTGSGSGQPLGVFTASANGISTGRDVSANNTTTAITVDGLINAKYALKGGYWQRAEWLFHRDALKMIAKLKDNDDQYLWRESVRAGEPDRLLGRPVMMSEFAPNTFTAGLYVGILGDFSNYWIADALDMQFQVLTELYAETNQNGYIGRMESDGAPVLEEAFARVTLASG